jgi:deoxyribonuclease-4
LLIGAHVSIAGGVSRAFERARVVRAQSIQIFTKSARGWLAPPLAAAETRSFRRQAQSNGLPSIAHGSYLINLATDDGALRDKSIQCALEELSRCERLRIPHLVIHPGAHRNPRRGLKRIASALDEIWRSTRAFKARIALELTAGQGHCLGWRFEELAEVLELANCGDHLSICMDTCHLFAAGYDISSRKGYERVMNELDQVVGLQRISCFHLNDSKKPLGCRVDRHEEIGKGMLGLTAFRCLVNDERFQRCVAVLETPFPERYARAIRLLESMAD